MTDIFISYSRKDSASVYNIVAEMGKKDFPFWIDREGIELSAKWLDEITQAIEKASIFILFWSKNSESSKPVEEEIAMGRQRAVAGHLKLLVVMLDDTPLGLRFSHWNAADMRDGCGTLQIANFVNSLPDDWRRFNPKKSLDQQVYTETEGTPFVSVKLMARSGFKASIVGLSHLALPRQPKELCLCLQLTQSKNNNMIETVYTALNQNDLWLLHITGPDSLNPKFKEAYGLDDANTAQWQDCLDFIRDAVDQIATSEKTTLKIFALAPNALTGGLGSQYGRFWHIQYYNWTGGTPAYTLVLDLLRNRS